MTADIQGSIITIRNTCALHNVASFLVYEAKFMGLQIFTPKYRRVATWPSRDFSGVWVQGGKMRP